MRVCLISPGHLSTNPRLVKEAGALRSAGIAVSVIHGRFNSWGTANDRALAANIAAVRGIPFGPTEATRAAYFRQTLMRRGARALVQQGFMSQAIGEAAHGPIVCDLIAAACATPADLYIAHYVAALPAAARAARRHRAAYAFDAEDFHLGDLPDAPEHALEKKIVEAIEKRYLPGAAYVTAASPLIAEAYAHSYHMALPTIVLNVFPKANAPPAPTPRGSAQPSPSLYWFSQTVGPGRGLETALEAIARADSRPHLYLRGAAAEGYATMLMSAARRLGVAGRLHFLAPAPPHELERLGANYDLGYVGELAETKNRRIALTNKLFSYLLSGVPSLVSDIPSHRRLAHELGEATALFPVGDAAALATRMDRLLLNPDLLASARAHAFALGQRRFNWEVEAPVFLACVSRAVPPHLRRQA